MTDHPERPPFTAHRHYYLALKLPPQQDFQLRMDILKRQYDEDWELAADEDREKAAVRFVPRQLFIGRGY